ncbi:ZIP family metal transporter [Candidatus Pacearchaeota archaeon CG10_big_fil_rev_8_21_14_0_10_34_12]|nr:MAG: ZIP family metal transporter [Candidatus Pacearchaeota archaeon CG10_big_fil_rev_8_21_14_0_10_34_12]
METWIYALASVFVVSLISIIGIVILAIKPKKLNKFLIYLVSLSAGALFGGAFLHLLPELIEEVGFNLNIGFSILGGVVLFFILEKIVHWHHCHQPLQGKHIHSFAIMNLVGDGVHNFLDGLIIGASYLVNIPLGIATTFAVVLHEIPQEIGDFGVLLHGGFTVFKALMWNLVSALTAIIGAIVALSLSVYIENIHLFLVPIAIGGFIYIAGSDLIPELHKKFTIKSSILQLVFFVLGILVMAGLLFLE